MIHPLDYNPRKMLEERRRNNQQYEETIATLAKSVADEIQAGEDFSNNRNFSRDENEDIPSTLQTLEAQLKNLKWKYGMCQEFVRTQPHYRSLNPACKEAGRRACKLMEDEMDQLETVILKLKNSL